MKTHADLRHSSTLIIGTNITLLDANHKWLDGSLQIESWRVVYKDVELN